jgi:glutathione S-transferase
MTPADTMLLINGYFCITSLYRARRPGLSEDRTGRLDEMRRRWAATPWVLTVGVWITGALPVARQDATATLRMEGRAINAMNSFGTRWSASRRQFGSRAIATSSTPSRAQVEVASTVARLPLPWANLSSPTPQLWQWLCRQPPA